LSTQFAGIRALAVRGAGPSWVYCAADFAANGMPSAKCTAIARVVCDQAGFEICDEAMLIVSGVGYARDTRVTYSLRQCRGWMTASGLCEILKNPAVESVVERSFRSDGSASNSYLKSYS